MEKIKIIKKTQMNKHNKIETVVDTGNRYLPEGGEIGDK